MSTSIAPETIDEQMLEEVRAWIGRPLSIRPGHVEASPDNIRWFARAIGDVNPLYGDREYGSTSPFGTNVAPPTFVHSVLYGGILPGPPLAAVNAGNRYTFHRRLRSGDTGLRGEGMLKDAELVTSSRGITRILNTGHVRLFARDGSGSEDCFAEFEPMFWRMAPEGPNKGLRYEPRRPTSWTDEQLLALGRELRAERRRGHEPRFWGDVHEGESLDPIARGPYTQMDQVAYYCGERSKSPLAFDGWWRYEDDARDYEYPPGPMRFGPLNGHWDAEGAQGQGMPGAYDDGFQRSGVVATIVTNWMGDHGFLRELWVKQFKPIIPGDLVRIGGTVDRRLEEDRRDPNTGAGMRPVTISVTATNQLDQVVSTGTATVDLPTRG